MSIALDNNRKGLNLLRALEDHPLAASRHWCFCTGAELFQASPQFRIHVNPLLADLFLKCAAARSRHGSPHGSACPCGFSCFGTLVVVLLAASKSKKLCCGNNVPCFCGDPEPETPTNFPRESLQKPLKRRLRSSVFSQLPPFFASRRPARARSPSPGRAADRGVARRRSRSGSTPPRPQAILRIAMPNLYYY